LGLNTDFKLLLYADDTSVLISGDNMQDIQTKSRHVLKSLNHWFKNNNLFLNFKKTKVLKFETTKRGNMPLQLYYNNEVLYDAMNIKFLGLEIDKVLNWTIHVKSVLPKLGKACFAIRNMKLCSNIQTLRML
jgi:hypothetical protein